MSDAELRCPVCQARFRGTPDCSRCGADLRPLQLIALQAHQLEEQARHLLAKGDCAAARNALERACDLRCTPATRRLLLLARWLDA